MTKRFLECYIIVLMETGEQRMTRLPVCTLSGIGRTLREALVEGTVRECVITSNEGIYKYTASEMRELAVNPAYK